MQYYIEQWIARARKAWELMWKTEWGEREERTKKLGEEQIQTRQQEQAYEEGEEQREQNEEERTKNLQAQSYKDWEEDWWGDYAKKHWERIEQRELQAQAQLDRSEGKKYSPYLSACSIENKTYLGLRGFDWRTDYRTDIVTDRVTGFHFYKDINEAGVGQLCTTIYYSYDDSDGWMAYYSKGAWNEEQGLSILSPISRLQEADRFVITKSPIDALSYRQLEQRGVEGWRAVVGGKQASISYDQQSTVYISTADINKADDITSQIIKDFKTICKLAHQQGKTVVVATDKNMYNNEVWNEMTQILVHMLEEVGTNYHIEEPTLRRTWHKTLRQIPHAEGRNWKESQPLADEYGVNQSLIQTAQSSDDMDPIQASRQAQAHLDSIVGTTYQSFLSLYSIKEETYQELEGLKVSDKAAAFHLYKDINEAGVGQLCSTITYYPNPSGYRKRIEYFQEGLPRGLSILSPVSCLKEADRFIITESPVDALSYRQLERTGTKEWSMVVGAKQASVSYDRQSTVYISTCGTITNQIRKDLETVCKLAYQQGKTVVVATDKNKAWSEMAQSLVHILKEVGTNYHIEEPKLWENWNNTLRIEEPELVKKVAKMQTEVIKAYELAYELLERKTYQDSVLPQLGIEQETLEYFKDQVKANERSIVMTLHPIENPQNVMLRRWSETAEGLKDQLEANEWSVVMALQPRQGMIGRWSLSVDQQGSIQLPVSEELPPLSILKGHPNKSSQVVLVCSPLDALLHYQARHQLYREEATAYGYGYRGGPPNYTCYVYVGQEKYGAYHPFEIANKMFKNITPVLAIRGDEDNRFESLEASLRQRKGCYIKESIDTNAQVYKKLNLLAGLLQGVAGARGVGEEGSEEGEEEQQGENISKKQRYRPRL